MLQVFDLEQWQHHETQAADGEKRSCLIPVMGVSTLELEVRSTAAVEVNLITSDGLTFHLAEGKTVEVHAKLSGFSGVEIVANTPFFYRTNGATAHHEKVDPRSMTVIADESASKPMSEMIANEIRQALARAEQHRQLSEEEAVELVDDFLSGDLEFDDEPDMFGLGYEERMARHVARKAEEARLAVEEEEQEEEEEQPPAEQKPAAKAAGPAQKGKQGKLPIAGE